MANVSYSASKTAEKLHIANTRTCSMEYYKYTICTNCRVYSIEWEKSANLYHVARHSHRSHSCEYGIQEAKIKLKQRIIYCNESAKPNVIVRKKRTQKEAKKEEKRCKKMSKRFVCQMWKEKINSKSIKCEFESKTVNQILANIWIKVNKEIATPNDIR